MSGRSALAAMPMPESSPPPPIGTTSVSISGASSSSSSATVPWPGDDLGIVERVNEGQAALRLEPACFGIGFVEHFAVKHDFGAVPFGLHHLDGRGGHRHDDGDRHAQPPPVIGQRLRMVAGRGGDHAAGAPPLLHQQQFVERAALLVGGGELQVLELHIHGGPGHLRQCPAEQSGRAHHRALDPLRRRPDVGQGDGGLMCGAGHGLGRLDHLAPTRNKAYRRAMFLKKLVAAFAALSLAAFAAPVAADVLVDNVNGYTLGADGRLIRFNAILVGDDGRVERLYARGEKKPDRTRFRFDGKGRTLMPGLIDAHGHVMGLGFGALQLDLSDTRSLAEAQARIAAYAAANPTPRWIVGRGWNQERWGLGRFPTAADLDSVAPGRPVWLERVDGHAGWANSQAMRKRASRRRRPRLPAARSKGRRRPAERHLHRRGFGPGRQGRSDAAAEDA
jgi:hypothetical protein